MYFFSIFGSRDRPQEDEPPAIMESVKLENVSDEKANYKMKWGAGKHGLAKEAEYVQRAYWRVKEYFDSTSLHGLKYITEEDVSWPARLAWIVLWILALIFFFFIFTPIVDKHNKSPLITSVDTYNYPISNVLFPGVTVCSNIRMSRKNFNRMYKKPPWNTYHKDVIEQTVTNLLSYNFNPESIEYSAESDRVMTEQQTSIPDLIYKIRPSCERMFLMCKWQGEEVNCSDIISTRKTDDGFCCSFNTIDLTDSFAKSEEEIDFEDYNGTSVDPSAVNFPESADGPSSVLDEIYDQPSLTSRNKYSGVLSGYDRDPTNLCAALNSSKTGSPVPAVNFNDKDSTVNARAARAPSPTRSTDRSVPPAQHLTYTNLASKDLGLSFLIDPNLADEYINPWGEVYSTEYFNGFKVLIHDPYEYPYVSREGIAIGLETETFIGVSAQVTESTENVKEMKPSWRGCLLPEDTQVPSLSVSMKAFKEYNKVNCLLECRAAEMLRRCGCMMYYYPTFPAKFVTSQLWENPGLLNETSSTCTFSQLQCLITNKKEFHSFLFDQSKLNRTGIVNGVHCNCPDDCDQTVYAKDVSSGVLVDRNNALLKTSLCLKKGCKYFNKYFRKEFDALKEFHDGDQCHYKTFQKKILSSSLVHVYFKTIGVTKFTTDRLYGWQDIIAQFGGMVGLCMGFSLMSGCEFLYFLFFRKFLKKKKC